ncbi:MAG: hypothetical protein IPI73_18025 [Betaproteobacteria bacterium]|nr:hypothetical protein [Betaproteobacteria bacterium]
MMKKLVAIALWLTAGLAPVPVLAANVWQPLCPEGGLCSAFAPTFIRDGSALVPYTVNNGQRRAWVALDTLTETPAAFVCTGIPLPGSRCLIGGAAGGGVFDADGNALYTFNPSGLDGLEFLIRHGEMLQPTIHFPETSPPTIVTGITEGGAGTSVYLTRDEGLSWEKQKPNVGMWGWTTNPRRARTNFTLSPDGHRIWLVPGPPAPGLWQTPQVADTGDQLDFTRVTRVDDGSFPADVFQLRSVAAGAALNGGYTIALAQDGMYVSTDLGRSWTRSAFGGVVDDAVFAYAASADIQVVAARGSVFISRDRGQNWSELARGLPASRYALGAENGALVAAGSGLFGCHALACDGPGFAPVHPFGTSFTRVTEFYHPGLDHYFITGDEGEKSFVRSGGAGAGWTETGQEFWAWSPTWEPASAYVCRFYGDPVRGPNSHFYGASAKECRGLLALQQSLPAGEPRWNSEGYVFKVNLPSTGRCPANLLPVYRAYNNGYARGIDSNHRYVLDQSLLTPLRAAGWISEGAMFCVPANAS